MASACCAVGDHHQGLPVARCPASSWLGRDLPGPALDAIKQRTGSLQLTWSGWYRVDVSLDERVAQQIRQHRQGIASDQSATCSINFPRACPSHRRRDCQRPSRPHRQVIGNQHGGTSLLVCSGCSSAGIRQQVGDTAPATLTGTIPGSIQYEAGAVPQATAKGSPPVDRLNIRAGIYQRARRQRLKPNQR